MAALKLNLLGQFECRVGKNTPVSLPTRKAEVLLAYLALAPGTRHPRERLINLLWSDRGEEQARNSLRHALSAIRKSLADAKTEPMSVDRTTVQLEPDLVEVDALRLELLADESDIENLNTAASLFSGEFLEGIVVRDRATEEWLTHERERFKRIIVDVLTRLSRLQVSEGLFTDAIDSGERLVELDPLQESGWQLLMKAYQDSGDRNHALLAYKRCHEILARELGVEPEHETNQLQDAIRNGSTAPPPASPSRNRENATEPDSISAAGAVDGNSILVLPFENLSNDPEQQYFSEGITEGVIMGLSNYPSLTVLSRHFSFAIQEKKLTIAEISRQFGVRYVVEGSIRKTPKKLRITTQLVNTETGEQVWGKRYDADQEEIFDIEDDLTRTIVAQIKGRMDDADERIAYRKPARDMRSYDLLLQGRYHLNRFNPEDNRISRETLEECISGDPDNALAYNYLYRTCILDWLSCWTEPRDEMLRKAKEYIGNAMTLAPDDSIVQSSFAEYSLFARDFEKSQLHADKAFSLNPNDIETLATLSAVHAALGNIDFALELADTCRTLDPFHPWIDWVIGITYFTGKRFQDAVDAFQNMPNPSDEIEGWLAACYEMLGHHTEAERHLRRYVETVRTNMPIPPETLDEWHRLWQTTAVFKHDYDSAHPFDALCDAGLEQFIEDANATGRGKSHPSVVVLPFDNLSGDPEQEYFSDGITESIILNISLFPGLQVKSRNSSFAFKEKLKSVGEISKELGVDYVVEGSVRKSGERVRISVQLVDAKSGNQVWGKRYDENLDDIFDLEENLSRSIAATVSGRIESELQQVAIAKSASDRESYEHLLVGRYLCEKYTGEDMARSRASLYKCLETDPDNYLAHSTLYTAHGMDWLERWTEDPVESFRLAGEHCERAFQLAPDNAEIRQQYSEWLLFNHRHEEALRHVDKALEINPSHCVALGNKSFTVNMMGDHERAVDFARESINADPYNGWGHWMLAEALYNCGRFQEAVDTLVELEDAPVHIRLLLVNCYMELGLEREARSLMEEILGHCRKTMKSMPQSERECRQFWADGAPFVDEKRVDAQFEIMKRAGLLEILERSTQQARGELPAVVVLPFDNLSGDPGQEYFSDGITESVILNLSLFPDMQVKSRNSSFAYKEKLKGVGEISEELGVDYVVEGSIRRSTDRVRITVQLVEADSGNQVWGNRYDSDVEDVFEIEEQLARNIAATVTGRIQSDLQQIALSKSAENHQVYDLLLEGIYHVHRFTAEDSDIALEKLNRCLELDPDNSKAHAFLYWCLAMQWLEGWSEDPDRSFELAGEHAERALELDPEGSSPLVATAEYRVFCREYESAAALLDKALQVNPHDPEAHCMRGFLLNMTGDYEQAMESAKKCLELDPYHPWAEWIVAENHFLCGRYEKAIRTLERSRTSPGHNQPWLIMSYLGLGNEEKARALMWEYRNSTLSKMKWHPASTEEWRKHWFKSEALKDEKLIEEHFQAMLQAGLCDSLPTTIPGTNENALPTIVVLPFDNLSGDPEQEYFSDGITESIILNLSRFTELTVKSRHASFAFKERLKSLGEISKELQADYAVEGSVRKVGDRILVTVQLVNGASGDQVWGNRYESQLEDIFEIEENLSRTIAATVTGRIDSDLQRTAAAKNASDLKAYDLLLAGQHHLQKYTAEDNAIARDKLSQCLELEPDNYMAHVYMYHCHSFDWFERWTEDPEQSFQEAGRHTKRTMELEPHDPWVLSSHADWKIYCRDYDGAMGCVTKALEVNPLDTEALGIKAFAESMTGDYDAATESVHRCLELDPYHPWCEWILALAQAGKGKFEQAITTLENAPSLPEHLQLTLIGYYMHAGREVEARERMGSFLETAQHTMKSMPTGENEWREYFHNAFPVQESRLADEEFELLLKAGLLDGLDPVLAITDTAALPTIAVLPFENLSGDPEQEYFSDGVTDSIILNLSLYNGLNVKSRQTCFLYKSSNQSIEKIGSELGAQYIIEGSIRKFGDRLRLNVQLIETETGNQLWGKRYDENLEDIFELEQSLSLAIAGTIGGKIGREVAKSAVKKPAADLKSYEYYLRGNYHLDKFTPDDFITAQSMLEKSIEIDPQFADAHITLSVIHEMNVMENWTLDRKEELRLSDVHIRRGLELDPDNALVQSFMAEHMFFQRRFEMAEEHADKAIELNPTYPNGYTQKAWALQSRGAYEEAEAYADLSIKLDPQHPYTGWITGEVYRHIKKYDKALAAFRSMPSPPNSINAQIAACLGALERMDEARELMDEYHKLARIQMPRYPRNEEEWRSYWFDAMPYAKQEDADQFFDLLLQAGLCEHQQSSLDDLPAIVVLPFENLSGDPEQEYFCDGITDSIILNLSLFSGMRVKSRHSSFAYKGSSNALDQIAVDLSVQYAVEGSVRKAGKNVRIIVQLIEATSGNQLWGKRFDADLENLFELEQELSQAIAGTISGQITHDIKQTALRKPAKDLEAYDLMMRGMYHLEKFNLDDMNTARDLFNQCLKRDPDNAEVHNLLGSMYRTMFGENWTSDRAKTLELASTHAMRAVELDPQNDFIQMFTAEHYCYLKKFDLAEQHANYAIEINPTHPYAYSIKAWALVARGEHEEALKNTAISMQLDPHHPYTGWLAGEIYRSQGEFEQAIKAFRTVPHLSASLHAQIAACYAGLDQLDKAKIEMEKFRALASKEMPIYPANKEEWEQTWYDIMPYESNQDSEKFFDLLLKAGLCELQPASFDNSDLSIYPSIAVLPFTNLSNDPEQQYLSDGISESIVQGLGMYKGLVVKSSQASFAFRDSNDSVQEIAEKLDAQYLVVGSVRKSGNRYRISAQLVEAESGNQLWGKHFDAEPEDLLDFEQEISETLVSKISSRIDFDIRRTAFRKPLGSLQSYDHYLRGAYYLQRFNAEDQKQARIHLEKCIDLDPGNANALTFLAGACFVDLDENWTEDRNATLAEANRLIDRAMELEPDNAFVHAFAAECLIFQHDYDRAEFHADRAMDLNPTMPDGYAMKAWVLAITCRVEEALEYAEKCVQLDLQHPYTGWIAAEAYRMNGDYDRAIEVFRSMPQMPASVHSQIATCLAGAGRIEQAREEMQLYLEHAQREMPHFPDSEQAWRDHWGATYNYQHEEDFEKVFQLGLDAGLCDYLDDESSEDPSIAVLPFQNLSGDPEQEFFSDGITADIVSILSRIRHLRVVAFHSTYEYKERKASIAEIAAEQQVRYILEGRVRKSGSKVRINAELIDSRDESMCWSETYDREVEDIFAVQDDITFDIAVAMKMQLADGERARKQAQDTSSLRAWEYCMRAGELSDSYIRDNIVEARRLIAIALEEDSEYSRAWAVLGWVNWQEAYISPEDAMPALLEAAKEAAEKSLALNPESTGALLLQAFIHQIKGDDPERAIEAADRALEIAPGDSEVLTLSGYEYFYANRLERALELYQAALRLSPIHPSWMLLVGGNIYQRMGDFDTAIDLYQRSIDAEPDSPLTYISMIDACIEAGDTNRANRLATQLRSLDHSMYISGAIKVAGHDPREQERMRANLKKAGFTETTKDNPPDEADETPSIAVLPFQNMSGDPEQAFFATGITNDIINLLSKFRHMRAVSSYSSSLYGDRSKPVPEIAEELGVRYMLDGGIQKSGNRIRISAQLIDSRTNENCWSEQFDRDLEDIFKVQDEITMNIVTAMKVELLEGEKAKRSKDDVSNIKAWEYIVIAADLADSYIKKDLVEARELAEQSTQLEPNYASAWAMLGWVHWQEAYTGWSENVDCSLDAAESAARKSIELDPEFWDGWALQGFVHAMRDKPELAIEANNRAAALAPGNADAVSMAAFPLNYAGRHEEALAVYEESLTLSPHYPNWMHLIGASALQHLGHQERAIETYRKGIAVEPDSPLCRYYLMDMLIEAGRKKEAKQVAEEIRSLDNPMRIDPLIRTAGHDKKERERFKDNLALMGFIE